MNNGADYYSAWTSRTWASLFVPDSDEDVSTSPIMKIIVKGVLSMENGLMVHVLLELQPLPFDPAVFEISVYVY